MFNLLKNASPHVVRRALTAEDAENAAQKYVLVAKAIPAWGWGVLILTCTAFPLFIAAINYTLQVVFALAAIEAPEQGHSIAPTKPPAYKDIDGPNKDSDPLMEDPADPELNFRTHKPITAKIRTTIRHLQSVGGYKARWRGLSIYLVWSLCLSILSDILTAVFAFIVIPGLAGSFLATLVGRVILSRWEMGWTHIVISQPSDLPWYRRTMPWRYWKKIAGPTAINTLVSFVAVAAPLLLFFGFNLHTKFNAGESFSTGDFMKIFVLFTLLIVAYFAICVPADVALIRVQASMLSPEEEPVVPFDRAFGGRVIPEADGGSGYVGFGEAWNSFTKEARMRMFKLVLKIFGIILSLHFLFGIIFGVELFFIVRPALQKVHDKAMLDYPTADYAMANDYSGDPTPGSIF